MQHFVKLQVAKAGNEAAKLQHANELLRCKRLQEQMLRKVRQQHRGPGDVRMT
jgi:hypothetical protein